MKILDFLIKRLRKKEESNMPFERAIIVSSKDAIEGNLTNGSSKRIYLFRGDEIYDIKPYSKSMVKAIKEVLHIPVYKPKESEFVEGEEVVPSEVYYEKV